MVEWGIISTVLILTVLIIRRCCRGKIPHGVIYGLWLVVLVRLLVPVTPVESSFSILNFLPKQWEEQDFGEKAVKGNSGERNVYDALAVPDLKPFYNTETLQQNFPSGDKTENTIENNVSLPEYFVPDTMPVDGNDFESDIPEPERQTDTVSKFLYRIWLAGVILMGTFLAAVNLGFYARMKKNAVQIGEYGKLKVYDTDEVLSPCLFGVIMPAVYLDSTKITSGTAKEHILLHEATHYGHRDNIWAVLRAVSLCLHWYNPVVWYAAYVSEKDCELACDESVIRKLGEQNRISYGETLLEMICQSRRISNVMCTATTMVGTKKGIKERIKSVAQKKHFSKAAFIFLAVSALVVTACTFTGKESNAEEKALIKEAEEKLFENENYSRTMKCRFCPADYDGDGEKELFLFVRTGEDSVDVLYYNDGEVRTYRTEVEIDDLENDISIMELSGKTFCVYDSVYSEKITSKVLGIRDEKIVNYFMDYQAAWENEKYINGNIAAFHKNDVDVTTYGHVMISAAGPDVEEQLCTMTEYYYYDAAKDRFLKYPVYEITREEFLAVNGGTEAVIEFKERFDGDTKVTAYAKCNGKMILMGYCYNPDSLKRENKYCVYEYDRKENSLGPLIVSGDGNYEELDVRSRNAVSRYEQNRFNAIYQFVLEYEKTITCDGKILDFEEWWEEETAYVRIWEWTKENELLVHLVELPFVYENETAYLGKEGALWTTYSQVTDLETFNMLYTDNGQQVDIPDLFVYNIQAELADKNIEKYMDAESAFEAYFPLAGGRLRDIGWGFDFGVETAKVTYEFADKQTVTVELYKDYQGVWAVAEGRFRRGFHANFMYQQLTDEDFENAIPADEFSLASFYDSNTGRDSLIKEHIAAGVDVYYSTGNSYGMIVKNGDEKTLLPLHSDLWVLPQFFVRDYDNDGVVEAAVIDCTGRGTGYYTESISMIESANKLYDRVYGLSTEQVAALIDEKLQIEYDEEKGRISLELDTDNEASKMKLSVAELLAEAQKRGDSGKMGRISYGDICDMKCEGDSIICDILLQYVPDGNVTGMALSEAHSGYDTVPWDLVRVKIRYNGNGEFVPEDIFFTEEGEF